MSTQAEHEAGLDVLLSGPPRDALVVTLPPGMTADDVAKVLVAVVREQERIAEGHRLRLERDEAPTRVVKLERDATPTYVAGYRAGWAARDRDGPEA